MSLTYGIATASTCRWPSCPSESTWPRRRRRPSNGSGRANRRSTSTDTGSGTSEDSSVYRSSDSASGVGDLRDASQGARPAQERTGLALGVDVRLPTGDEENLLGLGTPRSSRSPGPRRPGMAPHLNLGYPWTGDSVLAGDVVTGTKVGLPDEARVGGGIDSGGTERLTLAPTWWGRG